MSRTFLGFVSFPLFVWQTPAPVAAGAEVTLQLHVETLRVSSSGTETLAADEARVLPGKAALLLKEVFLTSPASAKERTERISLRAEIRVESASASQMVVTVRSRVRMLAATGGIPLPKSEILREHTAAVMGGASQLFEVYASPSLGARVLLNVRWSPGEEAGGLIDPTPIALTARVYGVEGEKSVLMSENQLLAAVGGAAAATFNRSVPLAEGRSGEKRIRQDRLELTLSPRFQIGRSLSLDLQVAGEVVTLMAEGNIPHPVSHQEDLLLSPGIPYTLDLELVAEDSNKEGWDRVHLRLEITAAF
jgi:hypothetical protein